EPALALDGAGSLFITWVNDEGGAEIEYDPVIEREGIGHGKTGERSIAGPALCTFGPNAYVAWAGTDADNTLSVMPLRGESSEKKILEGSTSNAGPAIAEHENALHIAWAGKDAAHSLNIVRL